MANTIRDRVFTVLRKNEGIPHSIKEVARRLPDYNYEQVANSLADLAVFDERVSRTARGVYVYGATESVPESDEQIKNSLAELEGRCFTQVGYAQNGDLLITRDSDGAAFRATPL